MIAFFVNLLYRRFPPTFTNAKTTAILWRGCKFAGKKFIFPATVGLAALCGANRRGGCSPKGSELIYAQWVVRGLACYFTAEFATVSLNSAARRKRLYV